MEVKRLRTLRIEIAKTLNNQNQFFTKNLFVQSYKTAASGDKSLKTFGPKIWNSLPEKIKSIKNLVDFKNWFIPKLMCN